MELSRSTLLALSTVIHKLCGLALSPDKAYLVRHRLGPLVVSEGLAGFDELLARLQCRGGSRLHDAIVEAITTKETSFFRDRGFYQFLRKQVLPEFLETLRRKPVLRRRIRVWSAGCSTGQEPFSVAILIRDLVESVGADGPAENQFAVLATDLSAEALALAKTGRYSRADVERGLAETDLARHFHRVGKQWEVNETLRRLVQFRRFDLLASPSALGAFDLILCRNVLIYFDEATRRRVCRGLFGTLQCGGWLGLGAAESLFGVDHPLETVRLGQALCYRKPNRLG